MANNNPDAVKLLSDDEVAEIEARAAKASPSPWLSPANVQPWTNDASELSAIVCGDGGYVHHRNWKQVCLNMDFISRARAAIPALCQTVRALRAKYKDEDKDHRLTIDTFQQQERIWQQKFDEQETTNTALRKQLADAISETDTARAFVTRLTIEKQKLERVAIKAVIPYEALLLDSESRRWIAPAVWEAMENAVVAIRTEVKEQP